MQENESMTTLTIVVPVTKMAGNLGNLRSWLLQIEAFDAKVVLIHDIQDEITAKELTELTAQINGKFVTYIDVKLGSPGLARNQGLMAARSKWIMFVDSDDNLNLKEAFGMIAQARNNNQILVGNYVTVTSLGITETRSIRRTSSRLDIAMNPGLWRMILPLDIAKSHIFTEFRMGEDQEYLLGLNIFERDLSFLENIPYTYFRNIPEQLTSNPDAVSELSKVIPLTFSYLKKSSYGNGFYISVVLIRQLLTELKNEKKSKSQLLLVRYRESKDLVITKRIQLILAFFLFGWKKTFDA